MICPTCQVLAQSVLAGDRLLLCMGLFSIFLVGSYSDAAWLRESCLKPHAGEAFSVAEWRARRDSNFRSGFLVKMSSGDFLFDLNRSLDSDRAPGSGFSREQTSARHSSMDLVTLPASRPAPSPVPAFCGNPPRSLDRDGEKVITKVVAGIGFEPMTFRL